MAYQTLSYSRDDRVATITLNRPDRLNAITREMPDEIRAAVEEANRDDLVHVIVLQGAGRAFCAGYDLKNAAERPRGTGGSQEMPWDPFIDFQLMDHNTQCFQSLWRSYKPTICKIHGYAVAGGSDIALSCDLVVMAEEAKIGYPPARVWGCPTTMMWVYRVGAERAKRLLFTGDLIDGREAERIGLITQGFAFDNLDGRKDGSFASVTRPGTGVCEVCHTTTRYYNNTGTGEPHYEFPCYTCHTHERGFLP